MICKKEKCTGCFACINICPEKCIEMVEMEYGCIYPKVNEELCINCGLCKKVCPANNPVPKYTADKVYAAWSKDGLDRISSASGGAASVFSKKMIENGGVVFGAAIEEDLSVVHKIANNFEESKQFKGSKYVQSHVNDSFQTVKSKLKSGIPVLFIGTPCQIAGLIGYLQKPYDNLITCDLICHGVPPQRLLKSHLKNILKVDITNKLLYSFRSTYGFNFLIYQNGKIIYNKPFYKDLYYLGFMKGLFYRHSCYQCQYSTKDRVSDITIGDFWGLGKKEPFEYNMTNGVSVILVNTDKGRLFVESCNKEFELFERTLDEAVGGNLQLIQPTIAHRNRDKFIKLYKKSNFSESVGRCLMLNRIKYRVLSILIKIPLHKPIYKFYLKCCDVFKKAKNKNIPISKE